MRSIYIILMNTGTFISKIIKEATHYEYSHVVLSLDDKFTKLYSFGRKKPNNFLDGGFVTYGLGSDFFKRFKNTKCLVYELEIDNKKYKKLEKLLKKYEKDTNKYKYDIKGLLIRYFSSSKYQRKNYYVCSEFVATVLEKCDIYKFDKKPLEIRPEDFNKIEGTKKTYEGKFLDITLLHKC